MFRLALSLISSLQVGARIQSALQQSVKKAVLYAIVGVILLFAISFGLVAGYQALLAYGFTPVASAGVIAGALALLGVIVLLLIPLMTEPKKTETQRLFDAPAQSMAMVDKSLGKAMQQVGPLTLLVIAFAAGLLASRRR
jgi:ABC-type multidrug transport system fused ATPase/permease subunit